MQFPDKVGIPMIYWCNKNVTDCYKTDLISFNIFSYTKNAVTNLYAVSRLSWHVWFTDVTTMYGH